MTDVPVTRLFFVRDLRQAFTALFLASMLCVPHRPLICSAAVPSDYQEKALADVKDLRVDVSIIETSYGRHLQRPEVKEWEWPLRASIDNTQVSNRVILAMKRVKNIIMLSVDDANPAVVIDDKLVHLAGFAQLQSIQVTGPIITDRGLAHFKGLTRLSRLELVRTKVTGAGLVHLEGLPELSEAWTWVRPR